MHDHKENLKIEDLKTLQGTIDKLKDIVETAKDINIPIAEEIHAEQDPMFGIISILKEKLVSTPLKVHVNYDKGICVEYKVSSELPVDLSKLKDLSDEQIANNLIFSILGNMVEILAKDKDMIFRKYVASHHMTGLLSNPNNINDRSHLPGHLDAQMRIEHAPIIPKPFSAEAHVGCGMNLLLGVNIQSNRDFSNLSLDWDGDTLTIPPKDMVNAVLNINGNELVIPHKTNPIIMLDGDTEFLNLVTTEVKPQIERTEKSRGLLTEIRAVREAMHKNIRFKNKNGHKK